MNASLSTIIIYARDMKRTGDFYRRFFDFETSGEVVEGLSGLVAPGSGASILSHQAAKGVKLGQTGVKLSFSVPDVEAFKSRVSALGLVFGATHQANGYSFANAKDPDKNSVSISSRAYRNDPVQAQQT